MVSEGRVIGSEIVSKFGHNAVVSTTEEAIWEGASADYTGFLTTPSQISIVSTANIEDKITGAGARKVLIEGLDANLDAIQEEITMDGTTPVVSTASNWLRVLRVYVTESGTRGVTFPSSTGANVGTISVTSVTGGLLMAVIQPQVGQTQMAIYTVPRGHTAHMMSLSVNVSASVNRGANIKVWQRQGADSAVPYAARRLVYFLDDVQSSTTDQFKYSVRFEEKTDIWVSAIRSSTQDAGVSARFDLLVRTNA